MTGWNELDKFRKILVFLLVISFVLGTGAFAILGRQEGIVYEGCFLKKSIDTSGDRWHTVYSGKVGGESVSFTVTPERKVIYRKGNESITYTVQDDPTAVPDEGFSKRGIEVRQGDSVVFRGTYLDVNDGVWLMNEAGNMREYPPLVETAVELACTSSLTRRGSAEMFAYGLLCTAAGLVLIFFGDGLFRLDLAFRIRDAEYAEPSEWELLSRALGQVLFTVLAAGCYITCFLH